MNKNEINIITNTLKDALYLISDEYESLIDAELKDKYVEVMAKIENAVELLKCNDD
tara:strand:- start:2010 stop:2177 length:168 start_codon:yes stop_codon:yes gene_type:complete